MTAHDIHALSGAYAVDALDDLERARFEQHLAVCADCRAEVASLQETAGVLGELSETPPPPALRDRLLADIQNVRPLPPERPDDEEAAAAGPSPRRRRPRWPGMLAAAAVLAAVAAGTVVTIEQVRDDATQTVSAVDRVLRAGDAQSVEVDLPGDARARVVRSVSEGRAVLITHDMPSAPGDKVYQLWLQDDEGAMHPAGLMPDRRDQTVLLEGDAGRATGVGITVEPPGGSEEPTSAPVALFDFEQGT